MGTLVSRYRRRSAIAVLPPALLSTIFTKLDLCTLVRVERVSRHWREVARKSWSHVTRISLSKSFPDAEQNAKRGFLAILERCGCYVCVSYGGWEPYLSISEFLCTGSYLNRYPLAVLHLQAALKLCPNVACLQLSLVSIGGSADLIPLAEALAPLAQAFLPPTEQAPLQGPSDDDEASSAEARVDEAIVVLLEQCLCGLPNLQQLVLVDRRYQNRRICDLDSKFLLKMPCLRRLSIDHLTIGADSFSLICNSLAGTLECLSLVCSNSSSWPLSSAAFADCIARLRSLRELYFCVSDKFEDSVAEAAATAHDYILPAFAQLANLEFLMIRGVELSQDGMKALVGKLAKLKVLFLWDFYFYPLHVVAQPFKGLRPPQAEDLTIFMRMHLDDSLSPTFFAPGDHVAIRRNDQKQYSGRYFSVNFKQFWLTKHLPMDP